VSALIIDLAERRRARTLPPWRAEAGQPQPPLGKRPGDRVRCRFSGAIGTVLSWRVERLWRVDVAPTPRPTFMLGVRFPDMTMVLEADEVDPVAVGVPERVELPADVEA
jgi:hypothetical protein